MAKTWCNIVTIAQLWLNHLKKSRPMSMLSNAIQNSPFRTLWNCVKRWRELSDTKRISDRQIDRHYLDFPNRIPPERKFCIRFYSMRKWHTVASRSNGYQGTNHFLSVTGKLLTGPFSKGTQQPTRVDRNTRSESGHKAKTFLKPGDMFSSDVLFHPECSNPPLLKVEFVLLFLNDTCLHLHATSKGF